MILNTASQLNFGAASVSLCESCVVKLFKDKKRDYFNAFERNKELHHSRQIKENKEFSCQDATFEGENTYIVPRESFFKLDKTFKWLKVSFPGILVFVNPMSRSSRLFKNNFLLRYEKLRR